MTHPRPASINVPAKKRAATAGRAGALDATDVRRDAYDRWNEALTNGTPANSLGWVIPIQRALAADYLESREPIAHQPAGFAKLYTT